MSGRDKAFKAILGETPEEHAARWKAAPLVSNYLITADGQLHRHPDAPAEEPRPIVRSKMRDGTPIEIHHMEGF